MASDPVQVPAAPVAPAALAASPPQLAATAGRGDPQVGALIGLKMEAQVDPKLGPKLVVRASTQLGPKLGVRVGTQVGPNTVKSPKALSAGTCHRLEDLPNIGPAMAADLRAMGITQPRELAHRDAFVLYQLLCALSGKRQDPCVLDTFMAATDFMRGAAPAPWWSYTAQRKLLYGTV